MMQTTDIEIIKRRFWKKVCKTDDCWEWTSCLNNRGYGRFRNPLLSTKQKRTFAHRFSWELAYGAVPNNLLVLHRCDNRKCVRPDHLFLGTFQDNAIDCVEKGRHQAIANPECYLRGEEMSKRLRGRIVPPIMIGKKITREHAEKIRKSSKSARALAREYSLHESSIYKIRKGEMWAHLESPKTACS